MGRRVTILVTGAGGLLGTAVSAAPAADGMAVVGFSRPELDIADAGQVAAVLDRVAPAIVINAAGYTNVDGAESEPLAALRANVTGPAALAAETAARGVTLIHVSTDHVFGGRARRPYGESARTAPVNTYGLSKRDGEHWVRRLQPRHWIVRTSGLFGEGGRNFVAAVYARAQSGQPLRVVDDQECARTYAPDLAAALLELAASSVAFGTYHVTNVGAGTWYEFAGHWLARHLPTTVVEPVGSAAWGAAAARPAYSVLDCSRWSAAGLRPLRPVDEAVDEYVKVLQSGSV